MSFADEFNAATSLEQKQDMVEAERKKRIAENPDCYVIIPVVAPKPRTESRVVSSYGREVELVMAWIVCCPNPKPSEEGRLQREGLQMPFSQEEYANDFCYALNMGRKQRSLTEWKPNNADNS